MQNQRQSVLYYDARIHEHQMDLPVCRSFSNNNTVDKKSWIDEEKDTVQLSLSNSTLGSLTSGTFHVTIYTEGMFQLFLQIYYSHGILHLQTFLQYSFLDKVTSDMQHFPASNIRLVSVKTANMAETRRRS